MIDIILRQWLKREVSLGINAMCDLSLRRIHITSFTSAKKHVNKVMIL